MGGGNGKNRGSAGGCPCFVFPAVRRRPVRRTATRCGSYSACRRWRTARRCVTDSGRKIFHRFAARRVGIFMRSCYFCQRQLYTILHRRFSQARLPAGLDRSPRQGGDLGVGPIYNRGAAANLPTGGCVQTIGKQTTGKVVYSCLAR